MTETWLNKTIQKEAGLEHYETLLADRIKIKQGGTAIYVHSSFGSNLFMKKSTRKCELVTGNILALKKNIYILT